MTAGERGDVTSEERRPDPPRTGDSRPIGAERLAFVDVMRAVAVGRVVINHALPWPWMKWFESLPVMFFVSGTLVGRSLQTRPWRVVMSGRIRRLAMPTGVYLLFSVVMAYSGAMPGTTTHLWYVWTFLVFTALSAVLRRCIRFSPVGTMVVYGLAVGTLTVAGQNELAVGAAYGMAWVAGMIWAENGCVVPSRRFLVVTVAAGFATAVVAVGVSLGIDPTTSPSELGISMAALGAAWLAVGMLLRTQLEALMHVRGVGRFLRYLNHRLLTVYLWHLPATIVGRQWAEDLGLDPFWSVPFVLAVTVLLTGVATVALGGLEDRASASSKKVKARAQASIAEQGGPSGSTQG